MKRIILTLVAVAVLVLPVSALASPGPMVTDPPGTGGDYYLRYVEFSQYCWCYWKFWKPFRDKATGVKAVSIAEVNCDMPSSFNYYGYIQGSTLVYSYPQGGYLGKVESGNVFFNIGGPNSLHQIFTISAPLFAGNNEYRPRWTVTSGITGGAFENQPGPSNVFDR